MTTAQATPEHPVFFEEEEEDRNEFVFYPWYNATEESLRESRSSCLLTLSQMSESVMDRPRFNINTKSVYNQIAYLIAQAVETKERAAKVGAEFEPWLPGTLDQAIEYAQSTGASGALGASLEASVKNPIVQLLEDAKANPLWNPCPSDQKGV